MNQHLHSTESKYLKLHAQTRTHARASYLNTFFSSAEFTAKRCWTFLHLEYAACFQVFSQRTNDQCLRCSFARLLACSHTSSSYLALVHTKLAWRKCIVCLIITTQCSTTLMEYKTTNTNDLNERKKVNETKQTAWRCGFCHSSAKAKPTKQTIG